MAVVPNLIHLDAVAAVAVLAAVAPGDLGQLAQLREEVEAQHGDGLWLKCWKLLVVDHLEAAESDCVLLLRMNLQAAMRL